MFGRPIRGVNVLFEDAGVTEVDGLAGELSVVRPLVNFGGKGRIRVCRIGKDGDESVVYSSRSRKCSASYR